MGMTEAPSISFLRNAWNCVACLLDHSPAETFLCHISGPQPDIVVCDGTMIGFHKDLLPRSQATQGGDDILSTIEGSMHAERMLLLLGKCREL